MSDIKYVVVDNGGLAGECIIVFPAFMVHKDFERMGKIVSAGFVRRDDGARGGFSTYGESSSLRLKSRPEDDVLLSMLMRDRYE